MNVLKNFFIDLFKILRTAILLFVCFALLLPLYAQNDSQYYLGYLKISPADSLSVGLLFEMDKDSLLQIVMDSPMQYVFDIPVKIQLCTKDSVSLIVPSVWGSFTGKWSQDTIIGIFKQNRQSFKMTMVPTERKPLIRPQTPTPPYNYREEELKFHIPDTKEDVVGTLTCPQNRTPKALVILISGSGWQNRDEFIMGHAPFWVLSDFLTQNGYAVFRYDDRPNSLFTNSTTLDFVEDVQLMIRELRKSSMLQDVNGNPIPVGLLGHSEGGLVAFITASENSDIDFVITLAAPAQKVSDILLYQFQMIGDDKKLTDLQYDDAKEFTKKIYKMMEKANSQKVVQQKYYKIVKKYQRQNRLYLSNTEIVQNHQALNTPWFRTLFKINPSHYIRLMRQPLLALNGEKDCQVNSRDNLSLIQKNIKLPENLQLISYPGLNHLFQECNTGLPDEYGEIEQTISPKVLQDILKWLNNINLNNNHK